MTQIRYICRQAIIGAFNSGTAVTKDITAVTKNGTRMALINYVTLRACVVVAMWYWQHCALN